MSARLLSNPEKCHEIHDDIESCLWVLVCVAWHFFKHKSSYVVDLRNILDDRQEIILEGKVQGLGRKVPENIGAISSPNWKTEWGRASVQRCSSAQLANPSSAKVFLKQSVIPR